MKIVIKLKKINLNKKKKIFFSLLFSLLSPREASAPSVEMQVAQTYYFAFHKFEEKETLCGRPLGETKTKKE